MFIQRTPYREGMTILALPNYVVEELVKAMIQGSLALESLPEVVENKELKRENNSRYFLVNMANELLQADYVHPDDMIQTLEELKSQFTPKEMSNEKS